MLVNLTPHEISVVRRTHVCVECDGQALQPDPSDDTRLICPQCLCFSPRGRVSTVPASSRPARVVVQCQPADPVDGVESVRNGYGPVEGLPAPIEGVTYIVSLLVLDRCQGRTDVVAPDTGPTAVRYTDGPQTGQIRYVTRFVRPSHPRSP